MAPAVTPGRNKVEAAEMFGSPIACVSVDVHLVYLALTMPAACWRNAGFGLPYATGRLPLRHHQTLEQARPSVAEVMMINPFLSPVAPGRFPGINVLDTRNTGYRTIH
ncbi:hypothetical protein F5Y05DRAFT_414665 [Hypoxylon sp. FL0543]|nr:hypothetical protein F5Y05DRAFT_414665 [Hypoxylon sp. FL0543]